MKTKLLISVFLLFVMLPVAKSQWTYSKLSAPRDRMGAAVLGTKAYFAGGENNAGQPVSTIQVYDVKREAWDTDIPFNLSAARMHPACVAAGSKVFFAGGIDMNTAALFSEVDIWDTVTKQWTVKHLSVPRVFLSAVSNGEKVLFAGGVDVSGPGPSYDVVDIYDVATGLWSAAKLSISRTGMGAAVAGNRAFFSGGFNAETSTVTKRIDIYDFSTGTWSIDSLSEARGFLAGVALGNKVLFAGGTKANNEPSGRVDIFDISSEIWSTAELSVPRALFTDPAAASINTNQAVFSCGGHFDLYTHNWTSFSDKIDIYNSSTNTWSTGKLTQSLWCHAVAGLQDHFIVAGGFSPTLNAIVNKVEIYSPTLIHVPADYPKIQLAIDAASAGDTVLVAENTYYENINFRGKAIVVGSEFIKDGDISHISKTIINGSQPVNPDIGSVVTFNSGEDTTSVLCGFTITGGTGSIETIESSDWRIGGGIRILASGAKLLNNYIESNTVSNSGVALGGGIVSGREVTNMPWIVLRNNKVRNNKAVSSGDEGNGGGVLLCYNLIMTDNEISNNEANGSLQSVGGGAFVYGVFGPIHVNIMNNAIMENKAVSASNFSTDANGGGLAAVNFSGIVTGNTISYNKLEQATGMSGGSGALIQEVIADDLIFENNIVANNTHVGISCAGGGILLYNTGGKFLNNVIKENKATHGAGISIWDNQGKLPALINNTIAGNISTLYGGGLYLSSANAVVINTILWGNTAQSGSSIYKDGSNNLEVRYSDVQGDNVWLGEGNMNVDPEFGTDGYHLTYRSPLLNKGKSSVVVNGITYSSPLFDIDRESDARPFANTEPEIGADELQTDVSIGEPISANGLSISLYPNPAKGIVTISVKDKTAIEEVEIYNQTGQKVLQVRPVKNALDISSLQPGVYYCRLKADNQVITKKIVKY